MVSQLERLRKDYRELQNYEYKMNKQGKFDVVKKLKLKRDFLGRANRILGGGIRQLRMISAISAKTAKNNKLPVGFTFETKPWGLLQ